MEFNEFKQQLMERFVNAMGADDKHKNEHKEEVFNMLQKSYATIGGIHGSGFKDPDDMVANIHHWKLAKHDGKIVAAAMYKNHPVTGRKRVAVATDGSEHGKAKLAEIMRDDLKQHRSHGETSGSSLKFLRRTYPDFKQHAHTFEHVKEKVFPGEEIRKPPDDDPELKTHPDLKDHLYQRKIGDTWHTKVMVGTIGKKY